MVGRGYNETRHLGSTQVTDPPPRIRPTPPALRLLPAPPGPPQPGAPPPPPPPAPSPAAILMLTPTGVGDPTSGDAAMLAWMQGMGGDQIQLLVAKANDSEIYVELTPLGQPASTRRTLKDLAQVVETLHVARAWTRDVADPVWAADRPISWEAAKERLAQLGLICVRLARTPFRGADL